nr:hypothetical protein [Mycobacterium paraseoulense]
MIVAIRARWNVRPGAAVSGGEGESDSTFVSVIVQHGGTDSGPSEAAPPTPADGAPTPDAG